MPLTADSRKQETMHEFKGVQAAAAEIGQSFNGKELDFLNNAMAFLSDKQNLAKISSQVGEAVANTSKMAAEEVSSFVSRTTGSKSQSQGASMGK